MKDHFRGSAIHTLIFTDLDGTLLDDRYDLAGAANALDAVVKLGAIAIPVTSKTRRECEALNALRRVKTPLLFENGCGIDWCGMSGDGAQVDASNAAADTVQIEGPGYQALCERLRRVRVHGQFQFRGFSEMCPEELSSRTGLTNDMARLALQREATEPLVWEDANSSRLAFAEYLGMFKLNLVQGGRFWHVMPSTDKGQAAAKVVARWQQCVGSRPATLGCGDSPNDQTLLEYTDRCLLFPRPDGSYLSIADKPQARAEAPGHEAWLDAVRQQLLLNARPELQQHP